MDQRVARFEIQSSDTREHWGRYLDKGAFILGVLFFLSVFISKAAMNSVGALLLVVGSVSMVVNRECVFRENSFLQLIIVPVLFGCLAAIFSESGGLPAVAGFLNRMKFFSLPIVLASVVKDEKRLWWLLSAVVISGCISMIGGLIDPIQRHYGFFKGLQFMGRTADMLMAVLLGLSVCLGSAMFRKRIGWTMTLILTGVVVLFFWGMVMTGIRGAWLGFAIGLGVYSLVFNRKFLVVLCVLVVLGYSFAPTGVFVQEIESIGDTSSDLSNVTRLQLWKTGLDFSKKNLLWGAGSDTIQEQFKVFYENQPDSYQKKYQLSVEYPGHFHNSYIQLFAEGGLLFFVVFLFCGSMLICRLVSMLRSASPNEKMYIQMSIVVATGFLTAQFFHSELYSYGGALLMLSLFTGLAAKRWALPDGRQE